MNKKKKSLFLAIVFLILAIAAIIPVFVKGYTKDDILGKECVIKKSGDVKKCASKGRYVKIVTKMVYDAEYAYEENGKQKGIFIDIDLDNKSFIGLASTNDANKYFKNNEDDKESVIHGELTKFDSGVYKEVLDKIKADYVKQFTDYKEEDILGLFLPYQLNAYNSTKNNMYLTLGICGIVSLSMLILMIINLVNFFKKSK